MIGEESMEGMKVLWGFNGGLVVCRICGRWRCLDFRL